MTVMTIELRMVTTMVSMATMVTNVDMNYRVVPESPTNT
jgi:hypothetical protein